jgi:hypothetical protein
MVRRALVCILPPIHPDLTATRHCGVSTLLEPKSCDTCFFFDALELAVVPGLLVLSEDLGV